jgi:hypothetical protein
MADKRILKVSARQAAVAIVGTGTATISIYDLIHTRQTIDAANVELTISDVAYDVGNSANIKRAGNLVFACSAGSGEHNYTDSLGVVLNDKLSANVDVNLGAIEGTMVIQFTKGAGYIDPDRQNQGPGSL